MVIVMTLCPNCRSIQKVGTNCPLCKAPITCPIAEAKPFKGLTGEDFELEDRKQQALNSGRAIDLEEYAKEMEDRFEDLLKKIDQEE